MTKPLTWLCLFLALGSGLFLYQTKHRAQMLDREIAQVMKSVDAARARSGVLQAEYQLLSDPQRLGDLATSHLSLRPTAPGQFSTWADLERRLPPVGLPPSDGSPVGVDGSSDTDVASSDDFPVPPIPPSVAPFPIMVAQAVAAPVVAPVAKASAPVAPVPAPVVMATRVAPVAPRAAPVRMAGLPNPNVTSLVSTVLASAPRRTSYAAAPVYAGAQGYGAPAYGTSSYATPPAQAVGSSLGMARMRMPSPISTANAASFNGGAQ